MLKAREERERVAKWNKELLGFAYQIGLVADEVATDLSGDKYREAEADVLGLKNELVKRQEMKECLPPTKQHLTQFVRKVDAILT